MSDLVRGIVRDAPPAEHAAPSERPAPERSAEPPPARRIGLATPTSETQAARREPEPAEPGVAAAAEPSAAEPPAESAEPLFGRLQALLTESRGLLRGGGEFPWAELQALIDRAVTALARSADLFWIATNPAAASGGESVASHQARVCVLALRIGAAIGYDRARLIPLGEAAALFDVALWQMPDTVLRRADTLSEDELALWRSHPTVSAEIVRRWAPPHERIVPTILDHHEREHGQGFPRGLHGPAIDPDAKIVALADTYAGLTVPPSSRPRLRPHEAIRDIVKTRHEEFPSALIKALLSEISVFPPGTVVRLNTDEVGRVIAINRHHPLRPKVEIVADGKGRRLPAPKLLDLSEAPFVYITGPVGEGGR